MIKLEPAVKKQTIYVATWVIILSVFMQSVFLVIGKWDYTVLLGNILSAFASILNFLLLGITVQKSLTKSPEDAKKAIKASQGLRMVMMVAIAAIGLSLDCFNIWATIIPFLFPRISFFFYPRFEKKGGTNDKKD